jgi:hypothetical protein
MAMKQTVNDRLDQIFDRRDLDRRLASEEKTERESKENAFVLAFLEARENVFRPALAEIGEYVKSKGWGYEISIQAEAPASGGQTTKVEFIKLNLLTGGRTSRLHEYPGLSITADKKDQRVCFHESTIGPLHGGTSDSSGCVSLEEATADLVQEKVLGVIERLFSNPSSPR